MQASKLFIGASCVFVAIYLAGCVDRRSGVIVSTAVTAPPPIAGPSISPNAPKSTMQPMNQPSILKSPAYRFQLTYPRYISATWFSASQLANLSPVPLGAVELRDTENTLSDIAPPMLTVQIYSNTGHLALAQWLDTSPRLQPASNWTIKQIRVSTYDGLLAESHQYLSPGQYIFVAKHDLIYQFVVAGDIAQSILDSLQLN